MAIFVIPRAQTLRFVRIDNYPITGNYRTSQTMDNRLLMDEKWGETEYVKEYLQKFYPSDPILIQITTNYDSESIDIVLCNQDESTDPNAVFDRSTMYTYDDGSGNVTYNYLLDQSSVVFDGFFFVKITTSDQNNPLLEFRSESFEFNSDYSILPYIKWRTLDRGGIYWDEAGETIFGIRAEIFQSYVATSESSMYEGFNFQPETLFSVPKKTIELTGDPMPRYMVEKLELAFRHFYSWIDNVKVSSNGQSAKIKQIDRSNMYDFALTTVEVEYEDYTILQEIQGNVVTNLAIKDYDNANFRDDDDYVFYAQF